MSKDEYLEHYFKCASFLRRGHLRRPFYDLLRTYERCPYAAIRTRALAVCAEFEDRFERQAG